MAKRRMVIMVFLICLFINLMPCYAQAASTADAKEMISPDRACTLTLNYSYLGMGFSGVQVRLYKIADVSEDFQYTLTAPFAATGLILNGIQTNGEWNIVRSTAEAHIVSRGINANFTTVSNIAGQARFENLETGLYLATVGHVMQNGWHCYFDSALIALPGLDVDGFWQYQVSVATKAVVIPPSTPDDEDKEEVEEEKFIQLKVTKLWRGDEGSNSRPKNIEVDIFRDGTFYQTVGLSSDNNWSYSWTSKDDGAKWLVSESNVPQGYIMTVETRGNSFILTNTLMPEDPDDPPIVEPPETGDTSNILFNTVLMYLSGMLLIIFGVTRKRKRNEETN